MSAEQSNSIVAALSFVGRSGGAVKSLPGFQKGRHTLPTAVNAATSAFLAKLCETELTEQAESFFQRTRDALGYKRRELSLAVSSPSALLTARDFAFELTYSLEPDDPACYVATRTLRDLRDAGIVRRPEFDAVFADVFTDLSFALRKGVRVEAVIDLVEALDADAGLAIAYTAFAGGLDAASGLWLVFAPASMLAAMGADPEMEADTFFLSFVGVFVASVGLGYLWALQRWLKRGDTAFLRNVWRLTILFRLASGTYCALSLLNGDLDLGWLGVPLADFAFAAVQIWLLRAGWPEPEAART